MRPFIATLVGSIGDGSKVVADTGAQYLDMPGQPLDPSQPEVTRYRRKLWARVVDETTR